MWAVEDADLDELAREASRREAVLAVEPNEVRARDEAPPLEHGASFCEEDDLVGAAEADRLDEAAALCELLDQRCRNLRERSCDEDCVVRRVLGEPGAAVADDDCRVLDAVRATRAMSSQRSTLQTSPARRASTAVCHPKSVPISSTRSEDESSSASTIWVTSDGCVVT